ncbi:MAG: ATP-binding protein [Polyangia bacterium]
MRNIKTTSFLDEKDDALVADLLRSGVEESSRLEFKRAGRNDRAIDTVCAFANTDGGLLVIGVEDAKKASGRDRLHGVQENPEAVDDLRKLLSTRIQPTLNPFPAFDEISCTLRDGSVGSIMLISVSKGEAVHSVVESGPYVRLARSNRRLWSAQEISDLALRKGTVAYDSAVVEVPFELLDTTIWRQYVAKRKLTRPLEEAMFHVGLARKDESGRLLPTRAAVLLFAEEPNSVLGAKCAIRLFHFEGNAIHRTPNTNLVRPPRTIGGPLVQQIREARQACLDELASGVQVGPLGFEIVQRYPVRVIHEAITNAVLHRAYHLSADIHIRIFSDRVEVESPGTFPRNVSVKNLREIGSKPRNQLVVDHLREFPEPPNLDAGEGVRMMFETMHRAELYPPLYKTSPDLNREAVVVTLMNEARASAWDQVADYLENHASVGNAEVRSILGTDDTVRASKQLRAWVERGLLEPVDASSAKSQRRYCRPSSRSDSQLLFSRGRGK